MNIRYNHTMKKIVFATNNQHKADEVREMLNNVCQIATLKDIGCLDDIPETADTLEGNALQKARHVQQHYAYDCFADDTGLEVDALHGAPGVYSARYAGEQKDSADNRKKLLHELKNESNRKARFRTVIALIWNQNEFLFEGEVRGRIIEEERGNTGFGYDAIFVPDGYQQTFAELGEDVKNTISHRAHAIECLKEWLYENNLL